MKTRHINDILTGENQGTASYYFWHTGKYNDKSWKKLRKQHLDEPIMQLEWQRKWNQKWLQKQRDIVLQQNKQPFNLM